MRASRLLILLTCLLLAAPAVLMDAPPAVGQPSSTTNVLTLDLGTLGGESVALDVHVSGLVVGDAWTATTDGNRFAFTYDLLAGGPMMSLEPLNNARYTWTTGITDDGVIMGQSGNPAFAYDTTAASPTMMALPMPTEAGDDAWMWPEAMNGAGWLVGWWGDDNDDPDNYRTFVYDPVQDVTTNLGGFGYSFEFTGVNADSAVGWTYDGEIGTGFVQPLDGGPRLELNTELGLDHSYAYGINEAGWVIGEYNDGTSWHPFAWDQVSIEPVRLPLQAGRSITPRLINDEWIIAAEGWLGGYQAVAYPLSDLESEPMVIGQVKDPQLISDAGVVVGVSSDRSVALAYDLGAEAPETIELGTLGGETLWPYAVTEVDGHTIVVGAARKPDGLAHAVAWVLGVPDAPTIELVIDADGIVPINGLTADQTPTLAGVSEPNGPVVIRRNGTVVTTITAELDGTWSYTSSRLDDGTYEFSATLEPSDGWPSSPATRTVTVETIPAPTVTVGTAKVRGSTVTVPFTIEGTYDTLTCQLDDTDPVPCGSTTEHTFTQVARGDHDVTVKATTSTGLIGQGSTTATVKAGKFTATEPEPPTVLTVTITSVTTAKGGPISAAFVVAGGTAPYDTTCRVDYSTGSLWLLGDTHECSSPFTYPDDGTSLPGGKYRLTVTATDSADATATATVQVSIPGPKK